ncbi:MAG TPA: hypothetical protein VF230_13070 [Acidimicrobiales bacterium]
MVTETRNERTDPLHAALETAEDLSVRGCLDRPEAERARLASRLYERVHPAMAVLGLLFLAVVLAQRAATPGSSLGGFLAAVAWTLWFAFVGEYALRLVIAPDRSAFFRRTWWQLLFLAVPFLSMVRGLLFLRLARPTRVVLAAFRGSRSARATLTGRLGWVAVLTAIVAFSSADLLYGAGAVKPYGAALVAASRATINGQPLPSEHVLAEILGLVLAVYAVGFFATLAGSIGAFLLEHRAESAALPSHDARRATAR